MVSNLERRRSEEVRVKLAPAILAEFSAIAEGRGLLPATLAAVALGEYVERYRRDGQLARMMVLDASKRMVDSFGEGCAVEKVLEHVLCDPGLRALITGPEESEAG